jgi:hypothetical protein
MSGGTADPTHVYWDLENRKGLWARGEAMSETPTAKELIRGIRHAEEDWDAVIDGETLAERVEAVQALHWRRPLVGQPEDGAHHCAHCGVGVYWPCPTVRLLDGGKP